MAAMNPNLRRNSESVPARTIHAKHLSVWQRLECSIRQTTKARPRMKPRHRFYQSLRAKIGTRKEVSKLLGVHVRTIERREKGEIKISDEMVLALEMLCHR